MLKVALRGLLVAVIIAIHLAAASRPRDDRDLRRTTLWSSRWSRRACRVLGVRVRRRGPLPRGAGLVVLNHCSWLDPLLLSAIGPAVFVTSVETAEDSFLGRICAAAGCVFMERRRRAGLTEECGRLATLMRHHPVVVFPEATSSDGTRLLPFRPAAFAAAIAAQATVRPMALRYTRLDGRPITTRTSDRVCWHGDMTFLPHLARLLTVSRIDVEIAGLAPESAEGCRKSLATRMHWQVAEALNLKATPNLDQGKRLAA